MAKYSWMYRSCLQYVQLWYKARNDFTLYIHPEVQWWPIKSLRSVPLHDHSMVLLQSFSHRLRVRVYLVHVIVTFVHCLIGRCDHTAKRRSFCLPHVEKRPFKPLLVLEQHNEPAYHQAEVADDVWIPVLCAVVLARYACCRRSTRSHLRKMAIRQQESAKVLLSV